MYPSSRLDHVFYSLRHIGQCDHCHVPIQDHHSSRFARPCVGQKIMEQSNERRKNMRAVGARFESQNLHTYAYPQTHRAMPFGVADPAAPSERTLSFMTREPG